MYYLNVNFQVCRLAYRWSDLLHLFLTQPLPNGLKPEGEEGDTHRQTDQGTFCYCSELRNDIRPLGGGFCWDFVLAASFSRLRANISCNTVVFFLGFVCGSSVVPLVERAIGDKPTGLEGRDEDGVDSSFGLRSETDTEGTGDDSSASVAAFD